MFDNMLEMLLDIVPYSMWLVDLNGKFIFANKFLCKSLNKTKEDIIGRTIFDLYEYNLALEYEQNYREVEKLDKAKLFSGYQDGIFLECYIAPLKKDDKKIGFLGILQDQTERKKSELEIIKQKNLLKTIIDTIPDSIFYKDINGTYLDCNIAFAKDYYNLEKEEVIGKKDINIVKDNTLIKQITSTDRRVLETKQKEVTKIKIKDGNNVKYMESIKTPIIDNNEEVWGIVGISRDVTDNVLLERNLKKMSYIDKLTNVYNRAYFDNKIEKINKDKYLPISLIMGDVDGLKIVNDTLGHLQGDELLIQISNVLKKVCKSDNLIIRWGGDEFVILLLNTEYDAAENLCENIKEACRREESATIPLSISLGCATKIDTKTNIEKILKEAEDKLYKQKLSSKLNPKQGILKSLHKILGDKSIETKEHTNKVVEYSKRISTKLNLNKKDQEDLILVAQLHDIGKIGIPNDILLNPGKLDSIEFDIIKTHTEKGYRISKSNYELSHVAKSILSHHERWDGNGYPLGLKGEEIPYLARIISVLDSYDAMTSERTYKKIKTNKEACEEIEKCSGTQFDPEVVEIFLEEFKKDI